jgi:ketosteroid isomerase-like protein
MGSDKEKDVAAVRKWVESLFSSMGNNDLEKYRSLLSNDLVLMPPNTPAIHGIEAVLKMVQPWFEEYTMTNEIGETEIRIDSELAYVRIEYKDSFWPKEGGDIHHLDNKGLWILQRGSNDKWKAIRCMYNRNTVVEN